MGFDPPTASNRSNGSNTEPDAAGSSGKRRREADPDGIVSEDWEALRMPNPAGNSGLTLMLWRLKTLCRLGGGVRREFAGLWYSAGLARVGELAQSPSGTWECGNGAGAAAGAAQAQEKPTERVSADTRTEQEHGKSGNCAGSRPGSGLASP